MPPKWLPSEHGMWGMLNLAWLTGVIITFSQVGLTSTTDWLLMLAPGLMGNAGLVSRSSGMTVIIERRRGGKPPYIPLLLFTSISIFAGAVVFFSTLFSYSDFFPWWMLWFGFGIVLVSLVHFFGKRLGGRNRWTEVMVVVLLGWLASLPPLMLGGRAELFVLAYWLVVARLFDSVFRLKQVIADRHEDVLTPLLRRMNHPTISLLLAILLSWWWGNWVFIIPFLPILLLASIPPRLEWKTSTLGIIELFHVMVFLFLLWFVI